MIPFLSLFSLCICVFPMLCFSLLCLLFVKSASIPVFPRIHSKLPLLHLLFTSIFLSLLSFFLYCLLLFIAFICSSIFSVFYVHIFFSFFPLTLHLYFHFFFFSDVIFYPPFLSVYVSFHVCLYLSHISPSSFLTLPPPRSLFPMCSSVYLCLYLCDTLPSRILPHSPPHKHPLPNPH